MPEADRSLEELFQELILDHYRRPRNKGALEAHTHRIGLTNPSCGDELELTLALAGRRIAAIGIQVRGCAIAQASASLMSETVKGRTLAEARRLGEGFRQMMDGERTDLPPELASLRPLEAVRRHRSRIACALLAWQALLQAAQGANPAGGPGGAPSSGDGPRDASGSCVGTIEVWSSRSTRRGSLC